MFHMLTCFDLKPGMQLAAFENALRAYIEHMQEQNLVLEADPVGLRQRDTILDTDELHSQAYFFVTRFNDRAQSDAAVRHIESGERRAVRLHGAMYAQADNMVFLCWDDSTSP